MIGSYRGMALFLSVFATSAVAQQAPVLLTPSMPLPL